VERLSEAKTHRRVDHHTEREKEEEEELRVSCHQDDEVVACSLTKRAAGRSNQSAGAVADCKATSSTAPTPMTNEKATRLLGCVLEHLTTLKGKPSKFNSNFPPIVQPNHHITNIYCKFEVSMEPETLSARAFGRDSRGSFQDFGRSGT
jgi:hypothetical protein